MEPNVPKHLAPLVRSALARHPVPTWAFARQCCNPFTKGTPVYGASTGALVGTIEQCSIEKFANYHWALVDTDLIILDYIVPSVWTLNEPTDALDHYKDSAELAKFRLRVGHRIFYTPPMGGGDNYPSFTGIITALSRTAHGSFCGETAGRITIHDAWLGCGTSIGKRLRRRVSPPLIGTGSLMS